jgi:hypothetical protein
MFGHFIKRLQSQILNFLEIYSKEERRGKIKEMRGEEG